MGYGRKACLSLMRGTSLISSLKTLSKYSFCSTVRWFFQSPATPVQTEEPQRSSVGCSPSGGCVRRTRTFPHGCCGVEAGLHQVFVVCSGVLLHAAEGGGFHDTIDGVVRQLFSQESADLHNFSPQILSERFRTTIEQLEFSALIRSKPTEKLQTFSMSSYQTKWMFSCSWAAAYCFT